MVQRMEILAPKEEDENLKVTETTACGSNNYMSYMKSCSDSFLLCQRGKSLKLTEKSLQHKNFRAEKQLKK